MSLFRKEGKKESPPISTASLPDIVFMLLFFFMVTTKMRENDPKISIHIPQASEGKKLEKKNLISYIMVGPPRAQYQGKYGTEPRIQLNDQIAEISDIPDYIVAEREARNENEVPLMTTSIKVDEYTKMGVVTDIKQELRKVQALKISYSARKGKDKKK